MNGKLTILLIAFAAALMAPALATADPYTDVGFRGWGPRVGLSVDPDQVHFGAHFDYGHFAKRVRFQPNFEVGFSDNITLVCLNAEAAYRFSEKWDVWSPYLGGGVGLNIKSYDNGHDSDSDTDLGVNLLGGIEKGLNNGDRFFVESKLSLNDVPDVKITIGWTFYH